MRKVLLSFLIGCLGFISGQASTIVSQDWVPGPILGGNNGSTNDGRHLDQTRKIYTKVSYDPDLSALVIYSSAVHGLGYADLQYLTFGRLHRYFLTPGDETVIPINTLGTEVQRLTVCFKSINLICYLDVLFYIDDGILYYCNVEE